MLCPVLPRVLEALWRQRASHQVHRKNKARAAATALLTSACCPTLCCSLRRRWRLALQVQALRLAFWLASALHQVATALVPQIA